MEQNVIRQITAFYYATNEADRKAAETFLTAFQKSPESWQICRGLLLHQPLPPDSAAAARLFAATTLSSKILYSLGDLSANSRAELKAFLLLAAHAFDEAPPGGDAGSAAKVVAQLCKSLACLAVLTREWKGVARSLADSLGGERPGLLLEILAALPLEYHSLKQRHGFLLPAEELEAFQAEELERQVDFVVRVCGEVYRKAVERGQSAVFKKVFDCFNAWTEYVDIFHIEPTTMNNLNLTQPFFEEFLKTGPLFDESFSAIYSLITYCQPPNIKKADVLYKSLLSFIDVLRKRSEEHLVHREFDEGDIETTDKVDKLCILVKRACESFTEYILELQQEPLAVLNTALVLLQIKSRSCGIIILEFFSEFFVAANTVIMVSGHEPQKAYLSEIIARACRIMVDRCACAGDDFDPSEAKYSDNFMQYRDAAFDALLLARTTLNSNQMIEKIAFRDANFFRETFEVCSRSKFEVGVFSLSAITKKGVGDEKLLFRILKILEKVLTDPQKEKQSTLLKCDANLIIGNLVHVLEKWPDFFKKSVDYVVSQIDQIASTETNKTRFSESVAMTLETICYVCPEALAANPLSISNMFFKHVLFKRREHERHFTNGIFHAFAFLKTGEALRETIFACLEHCLARIQSPHSSRGDVIDAINGISGLVQCVDVKSNELKPVLNETMKEVLDKLWRVFIEKFILEKYNDEELMEATISRLCKHFVRNFPGVFKLCVIQILGKFVHVLRNAFPSSFVYLASVFVEKYNDEAELTFQILETFSPHFFKALAAAKQTGYTNATYYMIEDYYRLCYKYLGVARDVIFSSAHFEAIFVCAMEELHVPDYHSFELLCEVVKRTLSAAKEVHAMEREVEWKSKLLGVVSKYHGVLVRKIVKCIYSHKKEFMRDICLLLTAIINLDPPRMEKLVLESLNSEIPKMETSSNANFLTRFTREEKHGMRCKVLENFNGMCQLNFINK